MNDSASKREATNMERFGFANPFSSPEVQEKIRKTNLERYGVDHPMKCAEIRSKQAASALDGMSQVEERFDKLTAPNVVFSGYGGRVIHSKSVVHKLGRKMTELCPDFMVFGDAQYPEAKAASDIRVPMRGMTSRFVIEVFGNYYHSESVIGVPTDIHEQEVKDAYASAGIECLILWEKDIIENWDEIKGSVEVWITKAISSMNTGRPCSPVSTNPDVLKSLADAGYWRTLDETKKKEVVDSLVGIYQKIDFPCPSDYDSVEDLRKFCLWASHDSARPTRFGLDCCRRFVKSMARAHVKGNRSLYDMWHDEARMRKCIEWQFTNETGRHTAKRFLDAMCFKVGFRVVSNLHPSKVVQWIRKYAKPISGGVFFDPCAGCGGRILAAHVLGMKYIGIDANKNLVEELNQMANKMHFDAEIYHGDSSDKETVMRVMAGRKADVVFTSPPYFDKEVYSNDKEQSVLLYPDRDSWEKGFCRAIVANSIPILSGDGVMIMNIDTELNMCCLYSQGWKIKEIDVLMENSQRQHTERLVFISVNPISDLLNEMDSYIVCRHCGRKCQKVTEHIRRAHGMTKEQYEMMYPSLPTISNKASESISNKASVAKRGKNIKRTAYRCPNGVIVGKRDAWIRAWGDVKPPSDSIVDGSLFDPWNGKVEGIDYVVCHCGFRAANLTRHLNNKHGGMEGHSGQVKSQKCKENLSIGALASWDTKGRNPERDNSQNKTHKDHGLTEGILRGLKEVEGLSDVKIGERYGLSGVGVGYLRKKYGIVGK